MSKAKKSTPTPQSQMTELTKLIAKERKDSAQVFSGETIPKGWELLPTESLQLNLHIGGFPRGGITVLEGEEGAGKTTTALGVVALDQRMHPERGRWLILDVERSITRWFLESKGVDPDRVILLREDNAEGYTDSMVRLIETGEIDGVVLDSIAAMKPKRVMESSSEKTTIAQVARAMSDHMPRVIGPIGRHNVCAIYLNQLRENPGMNFGNPFYGPGGKAPFFYSLLMIRLTKSKLHSRGHLMGVKVTRNKPFHGPKKDLIYIGFLHNYGIDKAKEIISIGKDLGIVKRLSNPGRTVWTDQEGTDFEIEGRSLEARYEFLADNPELTEAMFAHAREVIDERKLLEPGATIQQVEEE